MLKKVITFCYYLLFILVPLFFSSYNSELFEINKMFLVYILTAIITGAWLAQMISKKTFIFKRTPLDIPIGLFLISQILSTIYSIDPHTSIWGYYSRANGGLLSTISYILLFYGLVSNFDSIQALKFLKVSLFGGLLVALYAIPEHFGVSLSCIFITGQATASCWVQDVQARVFASLGQPNWLAAYLAMLIFPGIYFFLTNNTKLISILSSIWFYILIAFYLAFTFTFSRGATLGLLTGIAILLLFLIIPPILFQQRQERKKLLPYLLASIVISSVSNYFKYLRTSNFTLSNILNFASRTLEYSFSLFIISIFLINSRLFWENLRNSLKLQLFLILIALLVGINLIFGSALTGDFKLFKAHSAPARPGIATSGGGTQLENGGTESGQIRLIVWRGAIDIFKAYPLFGSGVETFAYSYYKFRPAAHNLVSEWDFLYNKAHNEYLNYLATTGIVGLLSYLAIVLTFLIWSFKKFFNSLLAKKIEYEPLLILTIACSYLSYLIQNVFGFSVVLVASLFFIYPAIVFTATDSTQNINHNFLKKFSFLTSWIYKFTLINLIVKVVIGAVVIIIVWSVFVIWRADTFYKRGSDAAELGQAGKAYNLLSEAVNLNTQEPIYQNDLGFAAAAAAVALSEQDSTSSARLEAESLKHTQISLKMSPRNVSLWRNAIRTYFQLTAIDPKFEELTFQALDKSIELAPTDAKLYYNKALIYSQLGKLKQGLVPLQTAIALKPNYKEAHFALGLIYEQIGDKPNAISEMKQVLQITNNDPDALKKLQELQKTN